MRLWPSRLQVVLCCGLWGKDRQREAAVGEAHALGIVAEHLVCRLNHHTFVFGGGLATRLLDAMLNDELVNFSHVGTVPIRSARRNLGDYVRKLLEGI